MELSQHQAPANNKADCRPANRTSPLAGHRLERGSQNQLRLGPDVLEVHAELLEQGRFVGLEGRAGRALRRGRNAPPFGVGWLNFDVYWVGCAWAPQVGSSLRLNWNDIERLLAGAAGREAPPWGKPLLCCWNCCCGGC